MVTLGREVTYNLTNHLSSALGAHPTWGTLGWGGRLSGASPFIYPPLNPRYRGEKKERESGNDDDTHFPVIPDPLCPNVKIIRIKH